MSSSAFSSVASSGEQWDPSTEPWYPQHPLFQVPSVFYVEYSSMVQRKIGALERWLQQTYTAQEEAIDWFVRKFPPPIQDHVRTFLNAPSASYLAELEIQIHRPPPNQNLDRRAAFARTNWKRYVQD